MLGEIIKNLRLKYNITQAELASYLGVTPKAVSFYELGQREPSNEMLVVLARKFNVSVDYLLGEVDKKIIANNIIKYMRKSGKTQKELCSILGLKESTFSDWVTGKKYPRIDKIEKMANYFGVSKADLVEENAVEARSILLSADEVEVIKKYRQLEPDDKEVVDVILNIKAKKFNKIVLKY